MITTSAETQRCKRILVYCQHLSGAGHFVRCREIIRALAQCHGTWFMVGGPPVPGRKLDASVTMVPLPAIHRTAEGVLPLNSSFTLAQVFADRRREIDEQVRDIRPDALIIEHFPFSKWLLRDEVIATIDTARKVHPEVQIVCSVRDYPAGHEVAASSEEFYNEVLPTLNSYFDQLLVHADPQIVTLESQLPWTGEINIPIYHTGYVAEKPTKPSVGSEVPVGNSDRGCVVVSSGGLRDGFRLANLCVAAWKELAGRGLHCGRIMKIFAGLYAQDEQYAELEESIRRGPFRLHRFSEDFLNAMSTADLSISQGGYNTTMNVLQTRTRAILAPNNRMTDQICRSGRLAEIGLADVIDPESISVDELAERILSALARPMPEHTIALDGAERTCDIIALLNC